METLKRYSSFEAMKSDESVKKPSRNQKALQAEFEAFINLLKSKLVLTEKGKKADGKHSH